MKSEKTMSETNLLANCTDLTVRVVMFAQDESRRRGFSYVGVEHLLLGLLRSNGLAARVLNSVGITYAEARKELDELCGHGSGFNATEMPFTEIAKCILIAAKDEALSVGAEKVDTEHVLAALASVMNGSNHPVLDLLKLRDVSLSDLRAAALSEDNLSSYKAAVAKQQKVQAVVNALTKHFGDVVLRYLDQYDLEDKSAEEIARQMTNQFAGEFL